jgi:hypothetical protein
MAGVGLDRGEYPVLFIGIHKRAVKIRRNPHGRSFRRMPFQRFDYPVMDRSRQIKVPAGHRFKYYFPGLIYFNRHKN